VGEMTQALCAHINNKTIKKKKKHFPEVRSEWLSDRALVNKINKLNK
jgi:hypothetical protein